MGFVSMCMRSQAFRYTPDLLNEPDVLWFLSQTILLLHAVFSLQGSEQFAVKAWLKTPWNLIKCIDLLWVSSQVRGWVLDGKWFWFSAVLDDLANTNWAQAVPSLLISQTMVLSMLVLRLIKDSFNMLLLYCFLFSKLIYWCFSNIGWEPIHTNTLKAGPHIAFTFAMQRRNEQLFFDVDSRSSWWSQHWQNRHVRGMWPLSEAAASHGDGDVPRFQRCPLDYLTRCGFFPHPTHNKESSGERAFCSECWVLLFVQFLVL